MIVGKTRSRAVRTAAQSGARDRQRGPLTLRRALLRLSPAPVPRLGRQRLRHHRTAGPARVDHRGPLLRWPRRRSRGCAGAVPARLLPGRAGRSTTSSRAPLGTARNGCCRVRRCFDATTRTCRASRATCRSSYYFSTGLLDEDLSGSREATDAELVERAALTTLSVLRDHKQAISRARGIVETIFEPFR